MPFGPIESTITVRAFLALPQLKRGLPEVLAGEGRLDQPIRWAHAGEAPNIASLLRGGELLLVIGAGIGTRSASSGATSASSPPSAWLRLRSSSAMCSRPIPQALIDEGRGGSTFLPSSRCTGKSRSSRSRRRSTARSSARSSRVLQRGEENAPALQRADDPGRAASPRR